MNLAILQVVFIQVIIHISLEALANSHDFSKDIYEFCADNQVFSFSSHDCPGGVLLKKAMKLTDPCRCINNRLKIYSACQDPSSRNNHTYIPHTKICRVGVGETIDDHLPVKLLQPSSSSSFSELHTTDLQCRRVRDSCSRLPTNSFRNFNARRHNNANELHNDHGRAKRDTNTETGAGSSGTLKQISDPVLRKRIEETIQYMLELQFPSKDSGRSKIEPKSMSFQVLAKTVKIYNNIAPSIIIEDETLNSILALFLKKYSKLELPGYSGRLYVDDHINEQSFDEVMAKLDECLSRSSDSSQELEFLSDGSLCPSEITHVIHRTKGEDFGFKKVKHELGKIMPENRKYVVDAEDFILGALWKVFDTIYSYCFPYTFSYQIAQIMVNYHNIIENIFTSPWVYPDYNAQRGTSMYMTRIEHEDLSVLMKNIDLMDEAVHILSKFKPFFVKPLSEMQGVSSWTLPKSPAGGGGGGATNPEPAKIDAKKGKRPKRQKRSSLNLNHADWKDLEIWGGRAYCLQKFNPNLPASIENAYPLIEHDMLCM